VIAGLFPIGGLTRRSCALRPGRPLDRHGRDPWWAGPCQLPRAPPERLGPKGSGHLSTHSAV